MATDRTRPLTADEIRKIGNTALADVASKKITTSKALHTAKVSTMQKGAILSPAEALGFFRDAFNKARKG